MLLWSRPPAILWFLSHRWERNSPRRAKPSRRPQAAKSPCEERNRSIIVPSSVTASSCHLSLSPLAFGHLPLTRGVGPRGEGFFGGEPPHPPPFGGTFPPGGRLRRAATWGRPYGGNIALKNKKTLSSRDWDESVWFASWCHPISERPGRSLWTPCCGGGAAPVSRPAGGAVFGRVRLRGVLSTWGRSPWDLSLSGGIPVTHAPSWR